MHRSGAGGGAAAEGGPQGGRAREPGGSTKGTRLQGLWSQVFHCNVGLGKALKAVSRMRAARAGSIPVRQTGRQADKRHRESQPRLPYECNERGVERGVLDEQGLPGGWSPGVLEGSVIWLRLQHMIGSSRSSLRYSYNACSVGLKYQ